jgi:hypothetical protein
MKSRRTVNAIQTLRHLYSVAKWSLVLVICLMVPGCFKSKSDPQPTPAVSELESSKNEAAISNLIKSEDLILDLTPRLSRMANWFEENSAGRTSALQADLATCVEVYGLATAEPESVFRHDETHPHFVEAGRWPLAESDSEGVSPWEPLNAINARWETMKFGVISGDFSDADRTEFKLRTKVEARGKSASSDTDEAQYGMKGHQVLVFAKLELDWILTKWIQEDLFVERSGQPLFREVLADALKDPIALGNAQRSFLDEIILDTSKTGVYKLPDPKYSKWTTMTSDHVYPSVSVVDYNNDGWDDLFLSARWGPTQMLENQGDGTFVDVAEKIGVYEKYLVNCVLFVDLDNDGDKDLIMGRSLEPARYLRNDDGKFVDVTESQSDLATSLQYFTSGIAAADVNRDGLVDIYLSSYPPLGKKDTAFEHHFLSAKERKIYLEKFAASEKWVGTAGTANVMLMNRGDGRLERVPFDDVLSQWRRSYQPVWSDIDNDGDDDLYVCNDFAPDALLRNDTPIGADQPVFVDVTEQSLINKGVGFGMGASFGDFDADGDLDLYVSNMFSKAGKRIFKKLDSVDPRIEVAAAGCFLFVNEDGNFEQQAGSSADQFHVNQVGWSYGGQWADFDNDGRLDLYVPTGFYTAPKEIDTQVDL